MIPEAAVAAAAKAYRREFPYDENEGYVVRLILEAAAPHMATPRTVTTAEDLDALPLGSAVRSNAGLVWGKGEHEEDPDNPGWACIGDPRQHPAQRISLPATVLWEPRHMTRTGANHEHH